MWRRLAPTLLALLAITTPASAATRIYLQNATAAFNPTPQGSWATANATPPAGSATVAKMGVSKSGTATSSTTTEKANATENYLVNRFVSADPLRVAGAISGTLTFALMTGESANGEDALTTIHMWVAQGNSTSAVRCTLINTTTNGTVNNVHQEWGNNSGATGSIIDDGGITLATGAGSCGSGGTTPQAGDYIVMEIGFQSSSSGLSRSGTLVRGGTNATDLSHVTTGDSDTTKASWIEFTQSDLIGATYTPTNTATATRTPTATSTGTATPTATSTSTPTAAAGCGYTDYTPAADADDALLTRLGTTSTEWPPAGSIGVDTTATTARAGRWIYGGIWTVNEEIGVTWDTSDLGAAGRGVVGAVLEANITQASGGATRHVVAQWTSAGNDGWTTADYVADVGTTALDYATADVPRVGAWSFALSNPSSINVSGTTGLLVGMNGGTPTSDPAVFAVETRENAGSAPLRLRVYWCANTPTPTHTGTATQTATATATATGTPTTTATFTATATGTPSPWPKHRACPDRDGDDLCGVAIVGNEQTQRLWPWLNWLVPDADMLCDRTLPSATSAEYRQLEEAVTADGGDCAPSGTVTRGVNMFADIEIIDLSALVVQDMKRTETARRAGYCWGPGGACAVEAPLSIFETYASDPHAHCVDGPDFGTPCMPPNLGTPTPCAQDPAPSDPFRSFCQPYTFVAGDAGVTIDSPPEAPCAPPSMCQMRASVQAVYRNIIAMVREIKGRRAVPVLLLNVLPAAWRDSASLSGQPTTPLPSGTPYPNEPYQARYEVARRDLQLLRSWLHLYADSSSDGPLALIDLQTTAERQTIGRSWRWLTDQVNLATAESVGHCTCVQDADCGTGGVCTDHRYCTAGPRATCTAPDDRVCRGSTSQAHPGHAWCLQASDALAAGAVHDCIENLAVNQKPELETGALPPVLCSAPRIPRDQPTPWPTYTVLATATATETFTPSPTSNATRTHTPVPTITPGGPTLTVTPTPTITQTPTNTPALPPPPTLSVSCAPIGKGCNKLPTLLRGDREMIQKYALADTGECQWGYAPGSCALPVFGSYHDVGYPQPGGAGYSIPNLMLCGDKDKARTQCTDGKLHADGHFGFYKWTYACASQWSPSAWPACAADNNYSDCYSPACASDCTIPDAQTITALMGSPASPVSGPLDFDKYFDATYGPLWEWGRWLNDIYVYSEQVEHRLPFLQRYGRCNIATATVCTDDSQCPTGQWCNNMFNSRADLGGNGLGTVPDGAINRACVSDMLDTMLRRFMNSLLPTGCITKLPGETDNHFWNRCAWFSCYEAWETVDTNCGKLPIDTLDDGGWTSQKAYFTLASTGTNTSVPTCPSDPTMGDTAQIDCASWFAFCRDWTRRLLPIMYSCRGAYTPRLPSGDPGVSGTPVAPWEP